MDLPDKVYDFHVHIYPEKIARKAVESVGNYYLIKMQCEDGTVDELKRRVEGSGITNSLVHSVAVAPRTVQSINNFISEQCAAHPEFVGFGAMHADYPEPEEEIDRMISLGLRGVKIHPDTQFFDLDDPKMMRVYDYMRQKGLPLLAHVGDYRVDYTHPRRLKHILREFPDLTVIGAHFCGWSLWDLAIEFVKDENCFMDTSSSIMYTGNVRAKELINIYGADRCLFGSDFPMWDPKAELENFMTLGLTDEQYEKTLYINAERILGIRK